MDERSQGDAGARGAEAAAPAPARDGLDDFFWRPDEEAEDLAGFAQEPEPAEPRAPDERLDEYLSFKLSDEEYAVRMEHVREIVKLPPLTEVPRAPTTILGVMSLRGEVIPVFDLRQRLKLPPRKSDAGRLTRVVVVDVGEGAVGLLVDAVVEVLRTRPSSIEPPPQTLGIGVEAEFLAGIGRQRARMFVLLDLGSVLAPAAFGAKR